MCINTPLDHNRSWNLNWKLKNHNVLFRMQNFDWSHFPSFPWNGFGPTEGDWVLNLPTQPSICFECTAVWRSKYSSVWACGLCLNADAFNSITVLCTADNETLGGAVLLINCWIVCRWRLWQDAKALCTFPLDFCLRPPSLTSYRT